MPQWISSGLGELGVLTLMVLTLVINELFGGVDAHPLGDIRRFAQWLVLPLLLAFGFLVFIRITNT
jgi:hypothetical protein